MWNEEKSVRFDELRREEARRPLSIAEQAERGILIAQLALDLCQATYSVQVVHVIRNEG